MFPSNLHKNILQLDKQISLLEHECKNMEVEKMKKPDPLTKKCSKASKLSSFKCPMKKTGSENLKGSKKITPPFSARVQSVCSLQSNYSKPWSEIIEGERKTKQRGINTSPHILPIQVSDLDDFQNKFKREKGCGSKAVSSPHLVNKPNSCGDGISKEQILHKEVVFSNPGGDIEVIVTKKLNNPESKKISNLENLFDGDSCKHKEPKWSEILSLEPVKKREFNSRNKVQNIVDEIQANSCRIMQVLNNRNLINNAMEKIPEKNFEFPEKLVCQPSKARKTISNTQRPEKEIQCQLDDYDQERVASQSNNSVPANVLKSLISELEKKPSNEAKKLLAEMKFLLNELIQNEDDNLTIPVVDMTKNESPLKSSSQRREMYNAMKECCDNLMKEKQLLSEELAAKDKTIAAIKKREEEYLSLIDSLKLNLEKTKENAQDGIKALQELTEIKRKFLEQKKVSDALRKSYSKGQEIMQRCILENDKLKTQVQIYKLESQKHEVLLAGREAEIRRYREELENFQRQISDHLASLKSNAQAVDFEKVMEAIFQQSHIFTINDSDSFITEKGRRGSSKECNGLIHSSPTSRKNSEVNSSWKQISSIADHDQSIPNSNLFADLNHSKEKEFFQVYGEDESHQEKRSNESLVEKEKKKSSSFTSCISVHDDIDCEFSSTSKNEILPGKEHSVSESELNEPLPSKKVQSCIDDLLKNMKLQWSKEIRMNSPDDCTIDDFLNNSQISSMSVVSANTRF